VVCCERNIVNGVEVSKFKTVSISVVIRMPLERKFVTYNALIPYVLKRGSCKYNTIRKINLKTDELFGAVFDTSIIKKGEEQILHFFIDVIEKKEFVEKAIEFLAEIIKNPLVENEGFKKEFVDGEKENLKYEIYGRKNNKKEYARLRCVEIMCENEPFGIYGDGYVEDLEKIDEKNLYKHYRYIIDNYALEFYYVGNISKDNFNEYIGKYFDNVSKDNIKFKENIVFSKKNINVVKESENLSQGKLCIGIRTDIKPNSDEFYTLLVANEIFGGGANSKLFLKLREEKGLCYYINSFVYRFKTIISIQSGIKKEDFDNVIDLIKESIEEIQEGNFEKKDFDSAICGLIKKYESILDYPSGIMDFCLAQNMLGDNRSLRDVTKKFENISMRDISEVMKKIYIDTIYFLC